MTTADQPLLAAMNGGKITAMIVLIGIAVILLLLLVLGPVEQRPGFTPRPSIRSTDRDDVRAANDLLVLR